MSIFWSAATLSAALPSWFKPRTAFKTVRPRITRPVGDFLQRNDADDRGAEQDELHQVPVLAQKRLPTRLFLRLREFVRAYLLTAPPDFDRLSHAVGRRRVAHTRPPPSERAIPSARLGRPASPPRPFRRSRELRPAGRRHSTDARRSVTPGNGRTCASEQFGCLRCWGRPLCVAARRRKARSPSAPRGSFESNGVRWCDVSLVQYATNRGRAVGSAREGS